MKNKPIKKEKTLNVSHRLWLKITKDKFNLGLKTHEEVIERLYKIAGEIKNAED